MVEEREEEEVEERVGEMVEGMVGSVGVQIEESIVYHRTEQPEMRARLERERRRRRIILRSQLASSEIGRDPWYVPHP